MIELQILEELFTTAMQVESSEELEQALFRTNTKF